MIYDMVHTVVRGLFGVLYYYTIIITIEVGTLRYSGKTPALQHSLKLSLLRHHLACIACNDAIYLHKCSHARPIPMHLHARLYDKRRVILWSLSFVPASCVHRDDIKVQAITSSHGACSSPSCSHRHSCSHTLETITPQHFSERTDVPTLQMR